MDALFDVAQRTLTINMGEYSSHGDILNAKLNRYKQAIPLTGVKFGFTLTINDVEVDNHEWPPANVRYSKTNQDTLASYRLEWQPDDNVTIFVWLLDATGAKHEDTLAFVAPKPPQPYPSWVWNDGAWQPPIPYPDDGQFYNWDEDNMTWVEIQE